MGATEVQELNKSQGKSVRVPCVKCAGRTTHTVLVSVELSGDDDDGRYSISWSETHQVIQCLGCRTVSYRKTFSNSEDYVHNEQGGIEYCDNEQLYPSRIEGRKSLGDEMFYLPPTVRHVYSETLLALTNRSPVLAGIGLRALLESVCNEKNSKGKDLLQRVDDLAIKGVLTPAGAAILHKIRTLGNAAAHEAKPHTDAQLALAMDIVEHLLKDVYILPRQVESEFKNET